MARPLKDQQIDIQRKAIEEAIHLLQRKPVSELTMKEVAAEVGCRAPALYNYYRNKDALLRAVHDEGFERLYNQKLAAVGQGSRTGFERLHAGGVAYVEFALENPELYLLMFAPPTIDGGSASPNPFENDLGLKSLAILRRSITTCQAEGYLPGADPDLIAFTLWSTVHGAASLMIQDRSPVATGAAPDVTSLAKQTVETMMAFVANTREAKGE